MQASAPGNNDTASLRRTLGRFATGVTVITCAAADGAPRGITANSFTSVSLEPPLILWNIGKDSAQLHAFLGARYFAVNILARDQQAVAEAFARRDNRGFDEAGYAAGEHDVPELDGTVASLFCRTWRVSECGDHFIIVGEVLRHRRAAGEPLLYHAGEYASLGRDGG